MPTALRHLIALSLIPCLLADFSAGRPEFRVRGKTAILPFSSQALSLDPIGSFRNPRNPYAAALSVMGTALLLRHLGILSDTQIGVAMLIPGSLSGFRIEPKRRSDPEDEVGSNSMQKTPADEILLSGRERQVFSLSKGGLLTRREVSNSLNISE